MYCQCQMFASPALVGGIGISLNSAGGPLLIYIYDILLIAFTTFFAKRYRRKGLRPSTGASRRSVSKVGPAGLAKAD